MNQKIKVTLLSILGLGLSAQLIPFEIEAQSSSLKPIQWDTPRTQDLAQRACMECHGGQVQMPWYGKIAPISWFIVDHINEGREHLNFATSHKIELDEIQEEIHEGKMPLNSYTWLHPEAKLTANEKQELIQGLQKTFGHSQPIPESNASVIKEVKD